MPRRRRPVPWGPCLGLLVLACTVAQNTDKSETGSTADASDGSNSTNSSKPQRTGNPQIDYVLDPNLPRELNGFNLSNYPFYNRIPKGIDFKCEGLHDGFYASVPHKCQVYHHCLFEVRYDFLCANYTAFDQKNFICHFASEVDCKNSPKYYVRNEELYKTTPPPTTKPPPSRRREEDRYDDRDRDRDRNHGGGHRRRRPTRRPFRPQYYDYYDDRDYQDFYDYEEDVPAPKNKKQRGGGGGGAQAEPPRPHAKDEEEEEAPFRPAVSRDALFVRHRAPPKIRPPVPLNERDRYDRLQGRQTPNEEEEEAAAANRAVQQPKSKPTQPPQTDYDELYSDEVYEKEVSNPKEVAPVSAARRKPGHSERANKQPPPPVYDDEGVEEDLPRDSKPQATDTESGNNRPRRPFQKVNSNNRSFGNRRRFGQQADRDEAKNPSKEDAEEPSTEAPPRIALRPVPRPRPGRPRPVTEVTSHRSSATETPISNEAVEDYPPPLPSSSRGNRPFRPRQRPNPKVEEEEEPLRQRAGYGSRGGPSRQPPEDEEEDGHRAREAHPRRQTEGEGQFRPGGPRRRIRPGGRGPPRRRARPRVPDYDYEY